MAFRSFERREAMGDGRPYDVLKVVVVYIKVEAALFVTVDETARKPITLRAEGETAKIFNVGQMFDRVATGKVVFEPAHRDNRKCHAEHVCNRAGPRPTAVDKRFSRERRTALQRDALCAAPGDFGGHYFILDIDGAQLHRLTSETPQQSVGIAPPIVRRMRAGAEVFNVDRRETVLEFARRQQIDVCSIVALDFDVSLKQRDPFRGHQEQVSALHPVHRRGTAASRHRFLEIPDEINAVERHGNVLWRGELHPAATGRAQRRRELVSRVRFDYRDAHRWRLQEEVIGDAGPENAASYDDNVEFLRLQIRHGYLPRIDPKKSENQARERVPKTRTSARAAPLMTTSCGRTRGMRTCQSLGHRGFPRDEQVDVERPYWRPSNRL